MTRSSAARYAAFEAPAEEPVVVLRRAADLVGTLEGRGELVPNYRFWAKSPTFDHVILKRCCQRLWVEPFWTFRQQEDLRTLLLASPLAPEERVLSTEPHVAGPDALAQAWEVARSWYKLEKLRGRSA